MGAGRAFLASWKGTRVLSSFVGFSTNCTAGVVLAECSRMTVCLAVSALGTPSVCDVVVQLAFAVAYNKILATNGSFLDVACECHNDCGVCFGHPSVGRSQPPWGLTLNQLGIVSSDTVRDFE
jgi:hypothetical protein